MFEVHLLGINKERSSKFSASQAVFCPGTWFQVPREVRTWRGYSWIKQQSRAGQPRRGRGQSCAACAVIEDCGQVGGRSSIFPFNRLWLLESWPALSRPGAARAPPWLALSGPPAAPHKPSVCPEPAGSAPGSLVLSGQGCRFSSLMPSMVSWSCRDSWALGARAAWRTVKSRPPPLLTAWTTGHQQWVSLPIVWTEKGVEVSLPAGFLLQA